MTSIAPRPPAGTPLELRGTGMPLQYYAALLILLPSVSKLIHPHDTMDLVLGTVNASIGVVAIGLMIFVHLRARAMGCVLRLDTEGVTVKGEPTVPWADLSAVHWGKPPGKKYANLAPVVFVPRPGVELPPVPSPLFGAKSRGLAVRNVKRYGSSLLFVPAQLRTTGPEVLAAVQRLSPGTALTSA